MAEARETEVIAAADIGSIDAAALAPKPVYATGVAVHSTLGKNVSGLIEAAMVQAIEECHAKGIQDPAVIRERMMAAKDRALEIVQNAVSEASGAAT